MVDNIEDQGSEYGDVTCFSCSNLGLDKDSAQAHAVKSLRSWPIKSTFELPCGNKISTDEVIKHLTEEFTDLPCPCGDSSHWLIKVDYKGKKC